MTERWVNFFTKEKENYRSLLAYAVNHWLYNDPLYSRIKRTVKPPARILDVGSGPGLSAICLQENGYEVTGVDNDPELLTQAAANAKHFSSKAKFESADAFNLSEYAGQFDLVYSVGVIEHFEREKTVALLKEQSKCATYVVAVIPTKYSRYLIGTTDERLYTIRDLEAMFAAAGLKVVDTFGYGDIYSPAHIWYKRILPHALYRLLQNKFSYAMGIGCVGRRIK
jgi:2-polyprenyl-3-methyl-5-hydroxy-6-metoxy-1,4-benzoquinol methylase